MSGRVPSVGEKVVRLQVAGGRSRMERRIVRIEDQTGRRIPDLRLLVERHIAAPYQVGPVAGQHPLPVRTFLAIREQAVIDVPDISLLVGVNIVEAGDRLQPQWPLAIL